MQRRVFQNNDLKCRQTALLACDQELSLLELLCEDGFLEPSELPAEESSAQQVALLRRAFRRGFLTEERDDEAADMLMVKQLDSMRVWTDLADEDVHLRAPPLWA